MSEQIDSLKIGDVVTVTDGSWSVELGPDGVQRHGQGLAHSTLQVIGLCGPYPTSGNRADPPKNDTCLSDLNRPGYIVYTHTRFCWLVTPRPPMSLGETKPGYTFPVYVRLRSSDFISGLRRIDSMESMAVGFDSDGTEDPDKTGVGYGRNYLKENSRLIWTIIETSKAEAIIAEAKRKAATAKWKVPPKSDVKCWVRDYVKEKWLMRDYARYCDGVYQVFHKSFSGFFNWKMCVLADPNDPNTPPPMDFVPEEE